MKDRIVAFLRAVNVAGHGVIRTRDLELAFSRAGCQEVKSFIQSGNIVFSGDPKRLASEIFRELEICLKGKPVVIFRPLSALRQLVRESPLAGIREDKDTKVYVSFLAGRAKSSPGLPLTCAKDGLEVVGIHGMDVFVISRRVQGRFGFPNILVEKEFGVPATTRNLNTVRRIVEKF